MLSGPSGVGKGTMEEWLKKLLGSNLCQVQVRKTRAPRPNENEANFGFKDDKNFYEFECRGSKQRLYFDELDSAIKNNGVVLLESYYKSLEVIRERYKDSVDFISTFVSPLNVQEIRDLNERGEKLEEYVPKIMFESLKKRAEKSGQIVDGNKVLFEDLEKRAKDAVDEMRFAHNYRFVIPNHCHEYDSRWEASQLVGEPLDVVRSLADIITTGKSYYAVSGEDLGKAIS